MSGPETYLTLVLYSLPGLVLGFTLHELAHALAATALGDPTPRLQHRLTLDPLRHIDPLGSALLLAVGFGWAKPVQFNPFVIRSGGRRALVAAAGPLTNLVIAAVMALCIHVEFSLTTDLPAGLLPFGHGGAAAVVFFLLVQAFIINVILFVFNALPIPGLDGYHVAEGLLGGVLPGLFHWVNRNRSLVLVGAIALLFLLPQATGGAGNPLVHIIDSVNDFLTRTFIDPNDVIRGGIPNLFTALS